jgi:galactose mutarotase-like enzyme
MLLAGEHFVHQPWLPMRTVMTDATHTIRSGGLTATIKAQGAEMCSLASDAGIEFVWQAEPAWPRHAPLLFPIVGRLANDELRHRGRTYRMTQHGFARDSRFAWVERGESRCVLVLEDSETTRALYPFAFRLTATYTLDESGLESFTRGREQWQRDIAGLARRPSRF